MIKKKTNPKGYKCLECGSKRLTKLGFALSGRKKVQRWACNECYKVTLEHLLKGGKGK